MMKWVFSGFVTLAVLFGSVTGRMDAVSQAALTSCGEAVQLVITLVGSMCLWNGMMRVVDEAGLTKKFSSLLAPAIRLLFNGMNHTSKAAKAISMNMAANLLGLGNAATPLGIAAMQAMAEDGRTEKTASANMVMFVVLNTASLQLVPTSTAVMRAAAGSAAPMDIIPAVWVSSAVSVLMGILAVKAYGLLAAREGLRGAKTWI